MTTIRKTLILLLAIAATTGPMSMLQAQGNKGGDPTDRSGTITSGGTSQQIAAGNGKRVYFEFQNISDETQYINFGAAAVVDSNSFKILPGAAWSNVASYCPTGTINVIGATTGKKFVAKEK